jgi:transporter family protein
MNWIVYALVTVVMWGAWGTLGKVALRHVNWVQASLIFGLMTVIACALLFSVLHRENSWRPADLGAAALTGVLGTGGLLTFYLALEHGKASLVVPLTGLYPVLTVVLSILFLGEHVSRMQIAGVVCAVAAIGLISLGQ